VLDPIPKEIENTGYVVLNRPYAFNQWLDAGYVEEKYILMSEPDHLLLRPLPNKMRGRRPFAFPFHYITAWDPKFQDIARKFVGDVPVSELEKVPPIGNAPTFMAADQLREVIPEWLDLALRVHRDAEADKAWG